MATRQETVTSRDGTTIAFERAGSGPVIVLVEAALSDRKGTAGLARRLRDRFTVVNYDRRGRGGSTDTPPYAVDREVDDIEAVIDASTGSAYLFGSSSGAALALDAAQRLGRKVRGLVLYEPPFIVDDSRPPMADGLAGEIHELVGAGRRLDAVRLFFHKGMGIPAFAVTLMRWLMPGWSKMAAIAHTIRYDLALLAGTQAGTPLPAARWSAVIAPTLVTVGSKSEAFFHTGAKALATLLPNAAYRSLQGRDHSAVVVAPKALAAEIVGFVDRS
jgi:pimeloyl-ACP methyl ester carboxylesterase